MYEGKSHTLFAKYAVPQMIGLLFNSVYMIVDGVFIGNRLGRDAMAAAAVSVPLVEIPLALLPLYITLPSCIMALVKSGLRPTLSSAT